jgi:hypothetical protein
MGVPFDSPIHRCDISDVCRRLLNNSLALGGLQQLEIVVAAGVINNRNRDVLLIVFLRPYRVDHLDDLGALEVIDDHYEDIQTMHYALTT